MTNEKQYPRSCPCKRVPLYLSSFSAAEHGDVHALLRHEDTVARRQDAGGNTPLHLASQHGHVAATAMLLQAGCDVNAAASGATPLHRASFSGAVSTMRLLLEDSRCNLLIQDTSFGDLMTPLHKAAAGGRYLAVQLLVDALESRHSLQQGLTALDADGRTPLDVALEKQQIQNDEQKCVARWDSVAGATADWDKCVQLLQSAKDKRGFADNKALPESLPKHLVQESGCSDCDEAGQCRTASWETAFRAALSDKVDGSLSSSSRVTKYRQMSSLESPFEAKTDTVTKNELHEIETTTPRSQAEETLLGRRCELCNTKTVALYTSKNGRLVCKKCRKVKR